MRACTPACQPFPTRDKILARAHRDVAWLCFGMVAKLGSPLWWFRISFSQLEDLGGPKRDVQLFFSDPFFVMTVYAPDREKDLDVYETCIGNVIQVLWEGQRGASKTFHIAGDLTVELLLL